MKKTQNSIRAMYYEIVLIVGGLLGLLAAFSLMRDKIKVLGDADFRPSCELNPVFSCFSVMTSDQAEAFGFPNPILGLIGFSAVVVVGFTLLAKAKISTRWYWQLFTLGTFAGFTFNHWLIYQALFKIGALCLWCNLVWIVTAPIFMLTAIRSVKKGYIPGKDGAFFGFVDRNQREILLTWYVSLIMLTIYKFWYWFETVPPFDWITGL